MSGEAPFVRAAGPFNNMTSSFDAFPNLRAQNSSTRPYGLDHESARDAESAIPWRERLRYYMQQSVEQQQQPDIDTEESTGFIIAEFCTGNDIHCRYLPISVGGIPTGLCPDGHTLTFRLVIAEDLAPGMIKILESSLDVPPEVFYDHISARDHGPGDASGYIKKSFRLTSSQIRSAIAPLEHTSSVLLPCEMTAIVPVTPGWMPHGFYNVYHALDDNIKIPTGLGYLRSQWMASFKHTPLRSNVGRGLLHDSLSFLFDSYRRVTLHQCTSSARGLPTCKPS